MGAWSGHARSPCQARHTLVWGQRPSAVRRPGFIGPQPRVALVAASDAATLPCELEN